MTYLTPEDRERAERLAQRLGVDIPGDISFAMWSLPLLEALLDRIERLEGETWRGGQ